MNKLDMLHEMAETGEPGAVYSYAMALWDEEELFSDDVENWLNKVALEGDPEDLYKRGVKAAAEYDSDLEFDPEGDAATEVRQLLVSAAIQGHAGSCMELCAFEIELHHLLNAINWYRRGRELGHPHKVKALYSTVIDMSKGEAYPHMPKHEFNLFLKERRERLGYRAEEHIVDRAWFSIAGGEPENAFRLSLVLEDEEIEEAKSLARECREWYKSRPKPKRKWFW